MKTMDDGAAARLHLPTQQNLSSRLDQLPRRALGRVTGLLPAQDAQEHSMLLRCACAGDAAWSSCKARCLTCLLLLICLPRQKGVEEAPNPSTLSCKLPPCAGTLQATSFLT